MTSPRALRITAVATLMAFALSACYTYDPYTGEKEVSKTTKGAAAGAAAGAVIGVIAGNDSKQRKKKALVLAGVGALAGGAAGNYMDRQEAKLRQQLQGTGVSVTRNGDEIVLNMPGNVTFATNSADVNASFYPVLSSVATVLKEFDKTVVVVSGHTDSTGSDQLNMDLSQRRAGSVSGYLTAQGVNGERFITQGFGKTQPIASNDTPEGRAQNRRVEIVLSPITE